jgi:hypothetical protein
LLQPDFILLRQDQAVDAAGGGAAEGGKEGADADAEFGKDEVTRG